MSARRLALWSLLGALAAPLAAAGCGAHPHRLAGIEVDPEAVRSLTPVPPALGTGRKLPPLAIAVSIEAPPPGAAAPGTEPIKPAAGDDAPAAAGDPKVVSIERLPFDTSVLRDELGRSLAATGVFASVVPVGGAGAGPVDLHAAMEEARKSGASFLLLADFAAPALRHFETEFVVSGIVWIITGLPSTWIHNQRYELSAPLRLRLVDLNSGETLPDLPVEAARAEDFLNFHERTTSVWTYLLTNVFPSPFCPVDEDEIARSLAPAALARPVSQFLEAVGDAVGAEVYTFRVQKRPAPDLDIAVRYPLEQKELHLLRGNVGVRLVVEATGRANAITRVTYGKKTIFPARGAAPPGAGGLKDAPRRRKLVLEATLPAEGPEPLSFVAEDDAGRTTACVLVPSKIAAPKPKAAPAAPAAPKPGAAPVKGTAPGTGAGPKK